MDDDGSTMSPPASPPSSEPAAGEPPGVRAQIGATIEAGRRLFRAHVDLAKTELGEIVGEVKRMVALGALALGALLMVALLLAIGGMLFLGEWLFGSIGWGVLLGTLLLIDVAAVALLFALDVNGRRLGTVAPRRGRRRARRRGRDGAGPDASRLDRVRRFRRGRVRPEHARRAARDGRGRRSSSACSAS